MQFYAQDSKAAQSVTPGAVGVAAVPFNFSIDPDAHHPILGGNKPAIEDSFLYQHIGNVGIVGFSGA